MERFCFEHFTAIELSVGFISIGSIIFNCYLDTLKAEKIHKEISNIPKLEFDFLINHKK